MVGRQIAFQAVPDAIFAWQEQEEEFGCCPSRSVHRKDRSRCLYYDRTELRRFLDWGSVAFVEMNRFFWQQVLSITKQYCLRNFLMRIYRGWCAQGRQAASCRIYKFKPLPAKMPHWRLLAWRKASTDHLMCFLSCMIAIDPSLMTRSGRKLTVSI